MTSTHYTRIDSAVGPLLLVATERGLSGLHFEGTRHGPCIESHWQPGKDRFAEVIGQLGEYFAGTRSSFTFPLDLSGTDFQLDVWNALCGIGYGSTTSYGEIARRVHRPAAVRAVGMANGRNPVAVVVPCHRVIGADGSLTGYGGGLERKRFLLDLETRHANAH